MSHTTHLELIQLCFVYSVRNVVWTANCTRDDNEICLQSFLINCFFVFQRACNFLLIISTSYFMGLQTHNKQSLSKLKEEVFQSNTSVRLMTTLSCAPKSALSVSCKWKQRKSFVTPFAIQMHINLPSVMMLFIPKAFCFPFLVLHVFMSTQ